MGQIFEIITNADFVEWCILRAPTLSSPRNIFEMEGKRETCVFKDLIEDIRWSWTAPANEPDMFLRFGAISWNLIRSTYMQGFCSNFSWIVESEEKLFLISSVRWTECFVNPFGLRLKPRWAGVGATAIPLLHTILNFFIYHFLFLLLAGFETLLITRVHHNYNFYLKY